MTIRQVETQIRKRVMNALKAVGKIQTDLYRQAVTDAQTTPVGSHKRHGTIWRGETVERSEAGEFPRKEFNEANKGVQMGVSARALEVRAGVTEEGMPLYYLSHGHHPKSGEKYERLGMTDIFMDNLEDYRAIAREALEEEPGE